MRGGGATGNCEKSSVSGIMRFIQYLIPILRRNLSTDGSVSYILFKGFACLVGWTKNQGGQLPANVPGQILVKKGGDSDHMRY